MASASRAKAKEDAKALRALVDQASEAARGSLEVYAKLIWHIVNPGTPLVWTWHMSAICRHLEGVYKGDINTLLVNIPPASSKTYLCSIAYPTWVWGHSPEWRLILCGWSAENLKRDQQQRLAVLQSEVFKDIFPRWRKEVSLRHGSKGIRNVTNTAMGSYRLSSCKSTSLTGAHAKLMIVDDPNPGSGDVGTSSRDAIKWWDSVASTRFANLNERRLVGIQQRVALTDLSAHWLSLGLVDAHLCLPAVYDPALDPGPTPLGWRDPRKPGELLSPDRLGEGVLARRKAEMGGRLYSAQYQQSPIASDQLAFQSEWWRPYVTLPARIDARIVTIDGAQGAGAKSQDTDYTVVQVWARAGANLYLIDQLRTRSEHITQVKEVSAFLQRYPEHLVYVERQASGAALISGLRNLSVRAQNLPPTSVPKAERILAFSAIVEAGLVFLPNTPAGDSLKAEAASWSPDGRGGHDDQLDAASMAYRLWGDAIARARKQAQTPPGERSTMARFMGV